MALSGGDLPERLILTAHACEWDLILTHTPITQIIKIKLRTGKFSFNLYIIFRNIRSSLI